MTICKKEKALAAVGGGGTHPKASVAAENRASLVDGY